MAVYSRVIAGLSLAMCAVIAPLSTATAQSANPSHNAPDSFSELAKRLMPSVVNISTRQTVSSGLGDFGEGSPLEEFNEFFNRDSDGLQRVASLGSGFIIDANGIVVTNNHVIEAADEIDVVLADGTVLAAELVGTDPDTDIAVLKVEPETPLQAVNFADSDTAEVGDWVVAIGNPFGLGGTVTAGIVSARDRDINAGRYDDFIQTDAAINRGNSGGPLFNLDGDVVGVNTAIYSPTGNGGSVGVGFSVSSNLAQKIVAELRETGVVQRGWLGVRVQGVTRELAQSYGLKTAEGAIVTHVSEDGPAAKAGLEVGDLIRTFNSQSVQETRDLSHIVAEADIGAALPVSIIREGHVMDVSVTLELLDDEGAVSTDEGEDAVELTNALGMTLSRITDEDRRRHRIPNSVQGVIVSDIDPGSDAMNKLRRGDVIVAINFLPAANPEDALAEAERVASSGKPILVQFYRGGDMSFRAIRPPA